jgi:hypothetical protein
MIYIYIYIYNIVTCTPIARQQLDKYIPARANEVANRTSIARQRRDKHALLTIQTVLSAWSVQSGYKKCSIV